MARLKQLHPSNYGFQGNTSNEFENLIRYLNAAELGNKTLAELLHQLFDEEGVFNGPIAMRNDPAHGLQFRVGEYLKDGVPQPEVGWQDLMPAESLRGPAGVSFGDVYAPVLSTRQDFTATAAQTDFPVVLDDTTETLVYVNGVLQRLGATEDYTHDTIASPTQIIFNAGLAENDEVSVFRVTPPFTDGYVRTDWDVDSDRTVFAFIFDEGQEPLVYRNGILQRKGAAADYTLDAASDQIIFNAVIPAGDDVSAILIQNEAQSVVAGLMLESQYVNPETGNILGTKVEYADEGLAQAKIEGLVAALNLMASATVSASEPDPPTLFWLDTSGTEPAMKFWTGAQYVLTSGSTGLPDFKTSDANLFVKINGTGTGFTYGAVDLSGLIPASQRGAANGVATLDAEGRLTQAQAPSPRNQRVVWRYIDGAITDGNYKVTRIFNEKVRILGLVAVLDGGTANAEITGGGASVSSTSALSVSVTETMLASPVTLDASEDSIALGVEISSASSATGLEVGLLIENIA